MSGLTDEQVKRLEDASWRGGRNAWLAEVAEMVAEARAESAAEVRARVVDLIPDHPMWIGDDGKPLDYLPEREARIGDFLAALDPHSTEETR